MRFSVAARGRSFVHAGRGIRTILVTQHNAWLHALATVLVLGSATAFGVSRVEWLVLILSIVAVWTAESLNTAIEFLGDATSSDFHPLIGKAKDVAAGAVLICASGAGAVGVIIFAPYVSAAFG